MILHGGYCKEYVKGKRPVGVMLEDTWLLRFVYRSELHLDKTDARKRITIPVVEQESLAVFTKPSKNKTTQLQISFKWERRRRASDTYAPSLRSGSTMALWHRSTGPIGILFGGVTDEDTNEETLESTFHNDL